MKRLVGSFMAAGMIWFALAMRVSAQRASFTVGTATAAAGQKADGYIQVPTGVDAGTNIPVVVGQRGTAAHQRGSFAVEGRQHRGPWSGRGESAVARWEKWART